MLSSWAVIAEVQQYFLPRPLDFGSDKRLHLYDSFEGLTDFSQIDLLREDIVDEHVFSLTRIQSPAGRLRIFSGKGNLTPRSRNFFYRRRVELAQTSKSLCVLLLFLFDVMGYAGFCRILV